MKMKKRYLILENGAVFEGDAIGSGREAVGELVFTTGMTGYLETLTDPSFAGQIVVQTFPLIGNYGVIPEDFEGESALFGYAVKEICSSPSNFRSAAKLDEYLKEKKIPGVAGVDTRAITRLIREKGVMNAALSDTPHFDFDRIRSYRVRGEVARVSAKERKEYLPEGKEKAVVALIDYGAKRNIVRSLTKRGCRVIVLPHCASAKEILKADPDGIMLSNGPGDPAENLKEIAVLKSLLGKKPIFGICLGHQLLALAAGGKTEKLKFGHRGANQPVIDAKTKKAYITSQNHGYAVASESLAGVAEERFFNANDHSCEGLDYPALSAFSVQFHPEGCAGPQDTGFLFDRFLKCMKGESHAEGSES